MEVERTPPAPDGSRRRIVACAFGALLLVQFGQGLYELGTFGASDSELSGRWISEVLIVSGAALVAWRALTVEADRAAWRAIAASMALYVVADLYYAIVISPDPDPPYPSPSDLVYFLNYVPLYVGVALLARRGARRLSPRALLEALTGALAIGSLAAAIALRPSVLDTDGPLAAVATTLVYPALDVLLVTLLAGGLVLQRGRADRAYLLVFAGLVIVAITDALYVAALAAGTYADGQTLDLGWSISTTLLALAAWSPAVEPRPAPGGGWRSQALSLTFSLLIFGLLVWTTISPIAPAARVLLILAVLSLILLQIAGGLEHRAFRDERERLLRAQRDKALEASELKSAFLANMSHEIRSPLNGVIGMTDLLRKTELDAVQEAYAEAANRSGEALLGIVDDILDVSKIEAGMLALEHVPFSPAVVVDRALGGIAVDAASKGLSLRSTVEEDVPDLVTGDPGRVRQILTNLLTNAVKFTDEGGIAVLASAVPAGPGSVTLRLSVTDTGIGIAEADLPTMFEPFTQADASTARRYGGTGLGLTIARQLAGLMDGRVGAESTLGQGSTFWVELPLQIAPDRRSVPRDAVPAASRPERAVTGGRRRRILVVDDGAVNQLVATRQLEAMGCEVDVAGSGYAALDRLARGRYDAVLMDCQMPGLDGYETTRELRRREGPERRTLVVALTADAMAGDRERCLEAGMDDYLPKPLRPAVLAALLDRHLAGVG